MNKSLSRVLRASTISIVSILALIAAASICQAESPLPLDKHARKIEKRLAKYRPGTYLDFEFRDSSQTFGSLGEMSSVSFQFTDADNNQTVTHRYTDLERVKPAKEYIGEGSGHGRHVRFLVPMLISAGAAAAGFATYEAVR